MYALYIKHKESGPFEGL